MSPSDFLQRDLFQKNNKKNQEYLQCQTVWIQIRSNVCWALFARNVKPDLDPKLFWLTLADKELTCFFIFAAFYCMHLMDSSFRWYALIWGCSIIYREGSQLLGLHCLPDGTHLCPNSINDSSIIFFEKKKISAYMISVLISYPPKSTLLSI